MFIGTKEYVSVKLYRYAKDGLYGELILPLGYEVNGKKIIVPKGFKTDFASVPRIFHSIIAPIGKHTQPAIIHDYLYANGAKMGFSRKDSDLIFLLAMKECSVNLVTRKILYYAVRVFGFRYYNKG